ncbi:PadR family transcriptional regulator [Oscillospiraceae bacterium OttesenSCG-928-F05]|nr:PadR family transcriptional regulator [Oscillospiraceae bacterium OttesenSCG-928-F05]
MAIPREKALKKYIPMSETMYYILLSLAEPLHGYGIILHVEQITAKRVKIGAGTIYNSIARLERDGLIEVVAETDRRTLYVINDLGMEVLKTEIIRLRELCDNGAEIYNIDGQGGPY